MRTYILVLAVIVLSLVVQGRAYADVGETPNPAATAAINDTATKICGEIQQTGSTQQLKLTGNATAELAGLAKKLAKLGVSGAAEYNSNEYTGVIQSQLPEALRDVRGCKMHIFDSLKDSFFPKQKSDALFELDGAKSVTFTGNTINTDQKILSAKGAGTAAVDGNIVTAIAGQPSVTPQKIISGNGTGATVTVTNSRIGQDLSKFPAPTGEFSALSSTAIKELTYSFGSELEQFQHEIDNYDKTKFEASFNQQNAQTSQEEGLQAEKKYKEDNEIFQQKYLPKSLSLASEMMARLKKVEIPGGPNRTRDESDIKWGGIHILQGQLSGPRPVHCVALFLRYLADKLPE